MTYDTTEIQETSTPDLAHSTPPLCLVNYYAERESKRRVVKIYKPPGPRSRGRVIERRENLIILAFPPPPLKSARLGRSRKSLGNLIFDAAIVVFLIVTLLGCLASFRF